MLIDLFNLEMPNPKDIDEAIDKKFISKSKFAEDIEKLVGECKVTYIDAIVMYCEEQVIDLESVGKLVSKPLKEKIKCEAMELNYLKKTSEGKLPL